MIPADTLAAVKSFVQLLQADPELINSSELSFLRNYLASIGARLPKVPQKPAAARQPEPEQPVESESSGTSEEECESEESDLDFSDTDVIKEEDAEPQEMGDSSVEVTEEVSEKAAVLRAEAQTKFSEGDFTEAVALFTESIKLNPTSALSYAKRAACYIKLKKPSSAIRDCDNAISLNPDSAPSYKWRGFAYKLLGQWANAYKDLQLSLKLDYADDTCEAAKEIEPKYKRILEHTRKWDRKREERTYKAALKARNTRQKAYEKSKKEEDHHEGARFPSGNEPSADVFSDLFSDPELTAAMQDPEFMTAMSQGISNPEMMKKLQENPKFGKIFAKMQNKFGGMGGGFPGGTDVGDTPTAPADVDLD